MPKRRTKGSGSVHQRASDGMWIGYVTTPQGRRYVSARTQREALRKHRDLKASLDDGVTPTALTVEAWMDYWIREIAGRKLRTRTITTYTSYINTWINPHLGRKRLDTLETGDVRRMLDAMDAAGRSTTTQRQARAILQSALTAAMKEGKVRRNVSTLTIPPPVTVRPHGHLPLEDAATVIDHLAAVGEAGDWDTSSRFLVALLAGLRQGEALGLDWDHVILEGEPRLIIEKAAHRVPGNGIRIEGLKSRASYREVPLVPSRVHALAPHKATSPGGLVWGGDRPRDSRRDWQDWRDVLAAVGLDPVPLHAARATTASLLHDVGVQDLTIARILGQATVTVTQQHYIHSTQGQFATALGQVWKAIESS